MEDWRRGSYTHARMTAYASEVTNRLKRSFEGARDPNRAGDMSVYMRGQFAFVGIPSPRRDKLQRTALAGLRRPNERELIEAATALWVLPEREYQYAAADLLDKYALDLGPEALMAIEGLILRKSWWDTVDQLASHVVGTMVSRHPELATEMDRWVENENLWLVRTALIHELKFKSRTDVGRLLGYCERQAGHPDFFIRKAIGWALREYSKTAADTVRKFVAEHDDSLSGLSKREALLWLNGGRKAKP